MVQPSEREVLQRSNDLSANLHRKERELAKSTKQCEEAKESIKLLRDSVKRKDRMIDGLKNENARFKSDVEYYESLHPDKSLNDKMEEANKRREMLNVKEDYNTLQVEHAKLFVEHTTMSKDYESLKSQFEAAQVDAHSMDMLKNEVATLKRSLKKLSEDSFVQGGQMHQLRIRASQDDESCVGETNKKTGEQLTLNKVDPSRAADLKEKTDHLKPLFITQDGKRFDEQKEGAVALLEKALLTVYGPPESYRHGRCRMYTWFHSLRRSRKTVAARLPPAMQSGVNEHKRALDRKIRVRDKGLSSLWKHKDKKFCNDRNYRQWTIRKLKLLTRTNNRKYCSSPERDENTGQMKSSWQSWQSKHLSDLKGNLDNFCISQFGGDDRDVPKLDPHRPTTKHQPLFERSVKRAFSSWERKRAERAKMYADENYTSTDESDDSDTEQLLLSNKRKTKTKLKRDDATISVSNDDTSPSTTSYRRSRPQRKRSSENSSVSATSPSPSTPMKCKRLSNDSSSPSSCQVEKDNNGRVSDYTSLDDYSDSPVVFM